jgi:hypothetical protein
MGHESGERVGAVTDVLFWYQCHKCKTVATSPIQHDRRDRPLCCIQCHCYMRFLYSVPADTPELQALAQRGPVWNPGTSAEADTTARRK